MYGNLKTLWMHRSRGLSFVAVVKISLNFPRGLCKSLRNSSKVKDLAETMLCQAEIASNDQAWSLSINSSSRTQLVDRSACNRRENTENRRKKVWVNERPSRHDKRDYHRLILKSVKLIATERPWWMEMCSRLSCGLFAAAKLQEHGKRWNAVREAKRKTY